LTFRTAAHGNETEITVAGLDPDDLPNGLELSAVAPQYFERTVRVLESVSDARGEVGQRTLGQAVWRRLKDSPARDLTIALDAPGKPEWVIDVDNGDNPPLSLSAVKGIGSIRRIDFAFEPGDDLVLYWGNDGAPPPRYDLTLIADSVLSSPALGATLGTIESSVSTRPRTPPWFWWAAVGAGFLVVVVLARTLRAGAR
jgi:hypothetical protein